MYLKVTRQEAEDMFTFQALKDTIIPLRYYLNASECGEDLILHCEDGNGLSTEQLERCKQTEEEACNESV